MFLDEIEIYVKAGKGGDGAVSFRREKYIPRGGPDGGDGGHGGNIIFKAVDNTHGLSHLAHNPRFLAQNGENGRGKNKHGKKGNDLTVEIPIGTEVFAKDDCVIDIVNLDEETVIGHGGNGGWGNQHFASSIKQTPKWSNAGMRGDGKKLRLVLKTIADVGLVGSPNAGKSSFLSVVSAARPKIANYQFTTLSPNLGTVTHKRRRFIIADIPGLIEGASEGKGLGIKFLKHIERTRVLLYMIDVNSADAYLEYKILEKELKQFSPELSAKIKIVAINKIDLLSADKKILAKFKKAKIEVFPISTATKEGIEPLLDKLAAII
ncbi:MAG: GTPase ObgE [Candidatus Berkelbacteria bacterium]